MSDGDDTLVLCYHALSDSFPAQLSTTPARFASQLRALARRGYTGVTFSETVRRETVRRETVRRETVDREAVDREAVHREAVHREAVHREAVRRPPARTVAVTFDDGYRSVLELGLPILAELGWPATIFVPSDHVGAERPMSWPGIDRWLGGEHERELLPLSWEELRTLLDNGWEVGSHTCSHPRLTALDDRSLSRELSESKLACELHLKRPCRSLAYPYGDVDRRVVDAAAAAGYQAAAALPARPGSEDPLCWPRVGVYHKDGAVRFALKRSRLVRRLRRTSATDVGEL